MPATVGFDRGASERLPYLDEHSTNVAASADATWDALLGVLEDTLGPELRSDLAHLLGCADTVASGPRPLAAGSTLPGFRVHRADRLRELALAGRHRFSEYALTFRLEPLATERTHLRAESRASFPGARGAVYRALVVGSHGHVFATRRLLGAVKRRAERASADNAGEPGSVG